MIDPRDLRGIAVFANLTEEQLEWVAQQGEEIPLEAGGALFHEGDPADYMFVIFEGELQGYSDNITAAFRSFTAHAGEVTGALPFSRLQTFRGAALAVERARVGRFHKRIFAEMLQRMPALVERLVGLMLDRVRDVTRMSEQQNKLASLGKLSAGLAHELNNPAAALKRAASTIMEVRRELRGAQLRLDQNNLTREQRTNIAACEQAAMDRMDGPAAHLTPLERSDREQEVEAWMERHSVPEPWKLSPTLVEAAIDPGKLDRIAQSLGAEVLPDVLLRLNYSVVAARMVKEIEQSATRIFELVQAVKEYTYMDQAPEQEIDIHTGLESTLTILAYKLRKKSIHVERQFDRTIPKICGFGVELNQVWTNIIVNAIEAMPEGGTLTIRTCEDPRDVVVDIQDSGTGIAPAILPRIFDPFFTTKGVGEGTGLGLDTAMRVARKHKGDIRVRSKPGETVFKVSLPKRVPA